MTCPDDIAIETARILYLTYGNDALEMTELRCKELAQAGDASGLAGWQKVREAVKELINTNPPGPRSQN